MLFFHPISLHSRCVVYFGASTDIVVSFSAKLFKQYFFHQEFLIRYESIMSFGKRDIPGTFGLLLVRMLILTTSWAS